MKFQRGQSIVEFAFILPLFLLLFIGIVYTGVAFSDYLMISHTVRSITHEASLAGSDSDFPKILAKNTANATMKSDLYIWSPDRITGSNNQYLSIHYDTNRQEVVVIATAFYNTSGSYIARLLNNLAGKTDAGDIRVEYAMYSPRNK